MYFTPQQEFLSMFFWCEMDSSSKYLSFPTKNLLIFVFGKDWLLKTFITMKYIYINIDSIISPKLTKTVLRKQLEMYQIWWRHKKNLPFFGNDCLFLWFFWKNKNLLLDKFSFTNDHMEMRNIIEDKYTCMKCFPRATLFTHCYS